VHEVSAGAGRQDGLLPLDPPPLILLVEPEKAARLDIAHQLLDAGCEVVEADHAGEALSILSGRSDFDAMVVDLGLGGEDGLALVEHVRRTRPGVGVVMLSDSPEARLDPAAARVALLLKPASGRALVKELGLLLGCERPAG
jgi:CheY-like chemotaxis protein